MYGVSETFMFSHNVEKSVVFNFVLSINDNNIKQRSLEIYGEKYVEDNN